MNCPKCAVLMSSVTYSGIQVDRCATCEGIFFDKGELDKLLQSSEAATADSPEYSDVSERQDMELGSCPRCQTEMAPYLGPANLRIDRCGKCDAVFLDQGELSELLSVSG